MSKLEKNIQTQKIRRYCGKYEMILNFANIIRNNNYLDKKT